MTIHKKLNTGTSFDLHSSQSGCCPDDGTVCRYSYTFDDDGTTLTSIVIDGTVVQLGGIDPTGDLLDLINALVAKFDAAGYTSDQHVSVSAWRGADSLTIDIFSSVVFGDLVTSAATLTASVNCVSTPLCYWEIEVTVSDAVDFDFEFGVTGNAVGGNIAADYSTGNADNLRDDIIALFADEAYEGTLIQFERIEVREDFGEGVYYVGIWGNRPSGGNLMIDGEIVEPRTCKPNYSQAE